jgi:uncharacterized protein (TIGR00297 family)
MSGAWSAVVMGTGFATLGEPVWFCVLIAFFASSSFWSKWKRKHRAKAEAEAKYAKTGRRDAGQVWANGGAGLLLCAAHALWPDEGWVFAYVGVMAAVNADTWATEIGALSRSAPRSVTSGKPVAPGTSGGVTPLGSAAALAGAVFIGVVAALLLAAPQPAEAAAGTQRPPPAWPGPSPTRCSAPPARPCFAAGYAAAKSSAPRIAAARRSKCAASPG